MSKLGWLRYIASGFALPLQHLALALQLLAFALAIALVLPLVFALGPAFNVAFAPALILALGREVFAPALAHVAFEERDLLCPG